jgi:lipopolysaccharide/colanic/teichoic acid biosynthesis glycosyltransferase
MTSLMSDAEPRQTAARAVHAPRRKRSEWTCWMLLGGDVLSLIVATVLAAQRGGAEGPTASWLKLVLPVVWLAALAAAGSYRPANRRLMGLLRPVLVAAGCTAALIAVPALWLRPELQDRIGVSLMLATTLTGCFRLAAHWFIRHQTGPVRLLLVGSPDTIAATERHLRLDLSNGRVELTARCVVGAAAGAAAGANFSIPRQPTGSAAEASGKPDSDAAGPPAGPATLPFDPSAGLGGLLAAVDEQLPDAVMICSDTRMSHQQLRRLTWELADRSVDVLLPGGAVGAHRSRLHPTTLGTESAIYVLPPQLSGPLMAAKVALERCAAAVALALLAPVLLAVAVAIRLSGPGPVLFRQARTGQHGKVFVVFKFRTMHEGSAEKFLELAERSEQDTMFFKLKEDPRITRVGALLRRTSLDELPQLLNVVLGDMSLVGPRPLPAEVDQAAGDVPRRLAALPGITGQWQVSGRSDITASAAVELDIDYVDNWRPAADVRILRRTLRAVIRGSGAY